ncbi:hypothetical protein PIB30_001652 [Stylosanthes scabra]|uniref:Uncharacterized protein n=1 Tax=Stylosanthes scabra TaxID=79078 RepID=A0ABU6T2E3_9FABA|nr:hypothetical protein [Stylosanthes scabra]
MLLSAELLLPKLHRTHPHRCSSVHCSDGAVYSLYGESNPDNRSCFGSPESCNGASHQCSLEGGSLVGFSADPRGIAAEAAGGWQCSIGRLHELHRSSA